MKPDEPLTLSWTLDGKTMGLFDYVMILDSRFVCSEGHELLHTRWQTKDLGCVMATALIKDGQLLLTQGFLGTQEPDGSTINVYTSCPDCPAFVQTPTRNVVDCWVEFEIDLAPLHTDAWSVQAVRRVSPSTAEFLKDTPQQENMKNCQGPLPFKIAQRIALWI